MGRSKFRAGATGIETDRERWIVAGGAPAEWLSEVASRSGDIRGGTRCPDPGWPAAPTPGSGSR